MPKRWFHVMPVRCNVCNRWYAFPCPSNFKGQVAYRVVLWAQDQLMEECEITHHCSLTRCDRPAKKKRHTRR